MFSNPAQLQITLRKVINSAIYTFIFEKCEKLPCILYYSCDDFEDDTVFILVFARERKYMRFGYFYAWLSFGFKIIGYSGYKSIMAAKPWKRLSRSWNLIYNMAIMTLRQVKEISLISRLSNEKFVMWLSIQWNIIPFDK